MKAHSRTARVITFGLAAMPLAVSQAYAAQNTATWVGGGGSYASPAKWTPAVVPLNGGGNTYVVQIGPNAQVMYDITGPQQIDQFLLDQNSTFSMTTNSAFSSTDLTVLGMAQIAGSISAGNRSTFSALAAGTRFVGDAVTIGATGGSAVSMAATDYSVRALTGATFLNASGTGSLIGLSALQKIDAGSGTPNFNYDNRVNASDHAVIDLSGVKVLVAPIASPNRLVFNVSSAAELRLWSLQIVSGPTLDSGGTAFIVNGGTATLGPLQTANRMTVDLQGSGVMTMGGYAGNARVSNSTFSAVGGAQLHAPTLVGDYSVSGLINAQLLNAAGVGSLLDLSGLQAIDSASGTPNFNYDNRISASDHAVIDLSGVKTLAAPIASPNRLVFNISSGASVDLSSLQTVSGATLDSGGTAFIVNGGIAKLGPLQSANRMTIDLQGGGVATMGGYAGSAVVSNSTFSASGGAVLNAATLVGDYSAKGLINAALFSAAGDGSRLDLSGLRKIDSGSGTPNFNYANTINASDRAHINLAGVTSLVAPIAAANELVFNVTSNAALDLSSLQTVSGPTVDSGATRFKIYGGTATLGPLQSANRMLVDLQSGATMTTGGWAGNAQISNSTLYASGGSKLDAAMLVGDYAAKGLVNTTLMSAAGAGSTLNLAGLRTLDIGSGTPNFNYNNVISASDGGVIDLAGVRSISTPLNAANSLVVTAGYGGSISLASLDEVRNAGQLQLSASNRGSLLIRGMDFGPGVHINLTEAGSALTVTHSLGLLAGSTLAAGAGTTIDIGGSFSFRQVIESQMNVERAIVGFGGDALQSLEVGGAHVTLGAAGAPVLNNFAFGELVLGSASDAALLQLVDAVDNGNRQSAEALYLNGYDGAAGLHILGGSTLVLNGIDLYSVDGTAWVHINSLFKNGETRIEYDQGYIMLAVPEPASYALFAAGLGLLALRRRRQIGDRHA